MEKKVGILNGFVLSFSPKNISLDKQKGVCIKMSKTSNKGQLQHLVDLMEANAGIACGFHKGSKEVLTRFWKNAEIELNSMGPPTKCVAEWKKVWADQKKYVRQKAAQNLKNKKSTGGGPNNDQIFSTTEETIYNLIGMKSSVEGVAVKPFGLHDTSMTEEMFDSTQNTSCMDVSGTAAERDGIAENTPLPILDAINCNLKKDSKKDPLTSSYDALQEELVIQKELLETIKMVVLNQKDMDQTNKKNYRSLDKLGTCQEKHFKEMKRLKRKEIEEIRRHNTFMEKLRVKEIEYKLEKSRIDIQKYQSFM